MRTQLVLIATVGTLLLIGCGGDSDGDDGGSNGGSSSGAVVSPPPPGQARVSVDQQEFMFSEPGAVACKVSRSEFSFSFRIGDNETTIGAGGVLSGGTWRGEIKMTVANPQGEQGPVDYVVSLPDVDSSTLAFDGKSMSYSGPMTKWPAGGSPQGVDARVGTISVTCP